MKVYEAVVTLADGTRIEVEYPADADNPREAALKAACKKLGRFIPEAEPRIEHRRDGGGKDAHGDG